MLQKGLLFEILSTCWTSENPGKSGSTIAELAQILNVEECEVRNLVSLFSDSKWITEELCLDTFNAYVNSPALVDQHEQYLAWMEKANAETKAQRIERELAEKSLVSLIKKDSEPEAQTSIGYLAFDDRKLGTYLGWLPTKRFNGNGQVYYLTEEFVKDLKSEFKDVDVDKNILDIYIWLMRNPTKRKTYAQMPNFINYWLSNSKKTTSGEVVDFSEIDKMFG